MPKHGVLRKLTARAIRVTRPSPKADAMAGRTWNDGRVMSTDNRIDRGGRPAATTAHHLAAVAQRLFVERGFDRTNVEDIAHEAGISTRTFFRYFPTKADVLWVESDAEISRLRQALADSTATEPYEAVLVRAVVTAMAFPDDQIEWARHRAQLVLTEPAVQAQASQRHTRWRAAATEFVSARTPDYFFPIAVGHAVLAATQSAHEYWIAHPETQLADQLERALLLLLPPLPTAV
ncbi:UNVERIFIED_ORG: TetR family transcriptional regulator [Nocardia globerula]|uniref:TetR family transcriptional regulator n=2 Tax=Nocardiaceae TaxID=85025 RepID=A0A652YQQ5_NOCGL|nr:TetR family transcriptional regulator [Rhodococcus globerulus]